MVGWVGTHPPVLRAYSKFCSLETTSGRAEGTPCSARLNSSQLHVGKYPTPTV